MGMEDLNKSKAQPKRKKYFFEDQWDEFQAQQEFKRKKEHEEHLKKELEKEKIVKKYDEHETESFAETLNDWQTMPLNLPAKMGWERERRDENNYIYKKIDTMLKSHKDVERMIKNCPDFGLGHENFDFKTHEKFIENYYKGSQNDLFNEILKKDCPRSPFFNEGFEIKIMVGPNLQKEREKIKKFVEHKWIDKYLFNDHDRLAALNDPLFLECCDCEDECISSKCACIQRSASKSYVFGKLFKAKTRNENSTLGNPYGIFECNQKCACASKASKCSNRVVQRGIKQPLMLKATDDKGFGVFAGSFIPKGSFITTYLGRYVSSETEKQSTKMRVYKHNIGQVFLGSNSWETNFYAQAYNIESKHIEVAEDVKAPVDDGHDSGLEYEDSRTRSYFEKLENYPRSDILRQKFVVDAFDEGNLGRFLNHQCGDANCFLQAVFIENQDPRIPTLALFAAEDIYSGHELTWDYRYSADDIKKMNCRCGSEKCRKYQK